MDGPGIRIDEALCDGCGECVTSCHEGALAVVEGKARVVRPGACDGRGACVGPCPRGAISLGAAPAGPAAAAPAAPGQWPVQLRLLRPDAPFLAQASLLLCAHCAPATIPDFHARYVGRHALALACPKLDPAPEAIARLAAIVSQGRLRRLTVLRMEVPCCGGLVALALKARALAGSGLPLTVQVVDLGGGTGCELPG